MPSTQHHIIRRQSVQVEVTGEEGDGFALQRALPDLCAGQLAPALEAAFDRIVPPGEHWTVDVLDVDVGTLGLARFAEDLAAVVGAAVEAALRDRLAGVEARGRVDGVLRRTDAQAVRAAFLFYLRTGILPWWFKLPQGCSFTLAMLAPGAPEVTSGDRFFGDLADALRSEAVRERLVQLTSSVSLASLLAERWPRLVGLAVEVIATLGTANLPTELHMVAPSRVWIAVLTHLGTPDVSPEQLVADAFSEFAQAAANAVLRGVIVRHWPLALTVTKKAGSSTANRTGQGPRGGLIAAADDDAALVPASEGLHIDYAGTVLLHPFLPQLFEVLGIAAGDDLQSPARALSLLHFLSTGQRQAPEHELVLPKVLCGVPIAALADTSHQVSDLEAEEAVALLQAVVRHWDALGETSTEGLRGTFLVRPGKLSQRGNGDWHLLVETRGFDILLGQLPWGLGAIRLPWMKSFLWVDWPS